MNDTLEKCRGYVSRNPNPSYRIAKSVRGSGAETYVVCIENRPVYDPFDLSDGIVSIEEEKAAQTEENAPKKAAKSTNGRKRSAKKSK